MLLSRPSASSALAGLALLSSHAAAIPAQLPAALSRRENAVLADYNADPNMVIFGDTYYIYPTMDGGNGQDYYAWSSPDLVTWTRTSDPILSLNGESGSGNVPWANDGAWAPTIAERDGTYYFYHSGANPSDGDNKNIGVATGSSPLGPFTGQDSPLIYNNESMTANVAIDPQVFQDPVSGKWFLYWGNGNCLQVQLNDDMVSINWDTLGGFPALENYSEAPFMFYREPTYYLTYSIDVTTSADYKVGYATSDSPTGPWTSRGVILQQDPDNDILSTGHNSVVNVPGTDDWYIAYHRWAIPDGGEDPIRREVCLDRMTFGDDGLIQEVTPTLAGVPAQTI